MTRYYNHLQGHLSLPEKIAHHRELHAKLNDLANIPAVQGLTDLHEALGAALSMIERSIPYRAGDRVQLLKAPNCDNGWRCAEHFLVAGAEAVVDSVQLAYDLSGWHLDLTFESESYIPSYGTDRTPVPRPNEHVWRFRGDQVEKIP